MWHMMICTCCLSKEFYLRNLYIMKIEKNNKTDDDVYTLHV
jgi:hypothetical protein